MLKYRLNRVILMGVLISYSTFSYSKGEHTNSIDASSVKLVEDKPENCREVGLITVKKFRSDVSKKSDEFIRNMHERMSKEVSKKSGDTYRIKTLIETKKGSTFYYFIEGYAYDCSKK
jgi:hypothetical protein